MVLCQARFLCPPSVERSDRIYGHPGPSLPPFPFHSDPRSHKVGLIIMLENTFWSVSFRMSRKNLSINILLSSCVLCVPSDPLVYLFPLLLEADAASVLMFLLRSNPTSPLCCGRRALLSHTVSKRAITAPTTAPP